MAGVWRQQSLLVKVNLSSSILGKVVHSLLCIQQNQFIDARYISTYLYIRQIWECPSKYNFPNFFHVRITIVLAFLKDMTKTENFLFLFYLLEKFRMVLNTKLQEHLS